MFCIVFSSMNFVLIFHLFGDGCLVPFSLFMNFLFAHPPCETSFLDDSMIDLHDSTLWRNMFVDDVHDLFRYQFWHWFLMSVGIDIGSVLAPL